MRSWFTVLVIVAVVRCAPNPQIWLMADLRLEVDCHGHTRARRADSNRTDYSRIPMCPEGRSAAVALLGLTKAASQYRVRFSPDG